MRCTLISVYRLPIFLISSSSQPAFVVARFLSTEVSSTAVVGSFFSVSVFPSETPLTKNVKFPTVQKMLRALLLVHTRASYFCGERRQDAMVEG